MALQLIAGLAPHWFTPKKKDSDPHDPTPPQFLLKPLTQVQNLEIMSDGEITSVGGFIPSHNARVKMLSWGIQDWQNVNGPDGAPAKYSPGAWQQLPWDLLRDLATEILISSVLSEDERKNSPSQSASPETPSDLIATTANGADTATTPTPPQSPNG
ncbi:hypothetical protein ACJJIE_00020 (plasmid) [Microbulbifer sp. TRSA001]|uniref:hypothetical protein n=1 Tax=Microbulbifer sp. TRSA001 TaxID=3243381 RepID=UPI004039F83A